MYISLDTINFIEKEFLKEIKGYCYKTIFINEFEKVYIIEDSLILYSCIYESQMPILVNSNEMREKKEDNYFFVSKVENKYYGLRITELTQ